MKEANWEEIPSLLNGHKYKVQLPHKPDGKTSEVMIEKTYWDHDKGEQVLEVREYGKRDSWYIRVAPKKSA